MLRIGIIREGKTPPDARVALSPEQCAALQSRKTLDIVVQPAVGRCYSDLEYKQAGVRLREDLSDRDVLLGIKETPVQQLIPNKTYLIFSHTIKEQPYNRPLLQAVLQKNIRLIDYEVLTDETGKRLIAFGVFAGMAGAHNALYTWGKRSGQFELKRLKDYKDYAEARAIYQQMNWPPIKIVLTGTGRVGKGAALVLRDMGIRQVEPMAFLDQDFGEAVFTQLRVPDYIRHPEGQAFENKAFYNNPDKFISAFHPYTRQADLMINGIYWDKRAPTFFSIADMRSNDWAIQVIADVTCDIAPESSIPSTLRATTIEDPVFGFDPISGRETAPFQANAIDMMTIDNLPNELPRDASQAFGEQFINHILSEFFKEHSTILERATIAQNGQLGNYFEYLANYAAGV